MTEAENSITETEIGEQPTIVDATKIDFTSGPFSASKQRNKTKTTHKKSSVSKHVVKLQKTDIKIPRTSLTNIAEEPSVEDETQKKNRFEADNFRKMHKAYADAFLNPPKPMIKGKVARPMK